MNFTFDSEEVKKMKDAMCQEGNDLIATRVRAEVVAEAKFTGLVFMVQVGQIDQQEWGKWRWQP